MFARPNPDLREKDGRPWEIEKQLDNLPKQTIEVLAFRMKSVTNHDQVSCLSHLLVYHVDGNATII